MSRPIQPRTRRPRPRRKFLWVSVLLLLVVGIAAAVIGWGKLQPYKLRAAEFDLGQLREMESATLIYDRKEELLGRIFIQNRDTIPLRDLPFTLVQAVIAAEDNRFYHHHGVDYVGMARAFFKNWQASRITQGGSTLTMQLARNTFSLRERSYERKLVEVFLSMRIEEHLSKNDILELYLNRVYYGAGFYGAEAAARGYFGKSARDLTLPECAALAGLLKSPNNLSPWSNRRAFVETRNVVLHKMHDLKMIDAAAMASALAEDPDVKNRRSVHAESYALDAIRQQVIAEIGFEDASAGGYRVHTTIDSTVQRSAELALETRISAIERREDYGHPKREDYENMLRRSKRTPETDPALPDYLQGAAIVMDNRTGAIRALVGGRNFHHSEYNRALYSKRPPGTAFIPLVYAAAFDKGYFPGTPVDDSPMDNRQVMIGGTTGILGEWGAESADNRFEGVIPAREALVKSKNAATVRLGFQTGLETVADFARRAGIGTELRAFPSTFLGSSEVTLADLALAYTVFPGAGMRPANSFLINRIESKDGQRVYQARPAQQSVMRPDTAWQVHSCLAQVLETGTGDAAGPDYGLKRFIAGGKTGTAYNFTDTWFLGYSSEITCGVWMGFDKPRTIYRGAFSRETALPLWVDVMNSAVEAFPAGDIPRPAGLERIEICRKSGSRSCPACAAATTDSSAMSYFEWANTRQLGVGECYVHGNGQPPKVIAAGASTDEPGQWPRAEVAFSPGSLKPIIIGSPSVLGEDPYRAVVSAQATADTIRDLRQQPTTEVRRAEPVRPFDQPLDTPVLHLDAPAPLKF